MLRISILLALLTIYSAGHAQYWNSISGTNDINNINTGKVGIGTDPVEKLTVQGNIQLGAGTTTATSFTLKIHDGSSSVNSGNGRSLYILAGTTDNAAGKIGGNLVLRPGFPVSPATAHGNVIIADGGGKVGIGTDVLPGEHKLYVKGTMIAEEVVVKLSTAWPDYVFESNYRLMPLSAVERFIKSHNHLPEVPAAAAVEENGVALGDMNAVLLKKIEELTLYMIDVTKTTDTLKAENDRLKEEMEKLKASLRTNRN